MQWFILAPWLKLKVQLTDRDDTSWKNQLRAETDFKLIKSFWNYRGETGYPIDMKCNSSNPSHRIPKYVAVHANERAPGIWTWKMHFVEKYIQSRICMVYTILQSKSQSKILYCIKQILQIQHIKTKYWYQTTMQVLGWIFLLQNYSFIIPAIN